MNKMGVLGRFLSSAILILFALAPSPTMAGRGFYSSIYVFGDSLSDVGNDYLFTGSIAPPGGYYDGGRFSNGPVAVEYLWKYLTGNIMARMEPSLRVADFRQSKAVNFAYGGAGTGESNITPGGFPVFGLVGQANKFLENVRVADRNGLYVVWAGANDYLLPNVLGSECAPRLVECSTNNIIASIEELHAAGARHFMVANLPDLGTPPIVNNPGFYPPPLTPSLFTQLAIDHNHLLKTKIASLKQRHSDLDIAYIDIYKSWNTALTRFSEKDPLTGIAYAGPAGYCLFIDPTHCVPAQLDSFEAPGFAFWDAEHPTTAMHKMLARDMLSGLIRRVFD